MCGRCELYAATDGQRSLPFVVRQTFLAMMWLAMGVQKLIAIAEV